MPTYERHAVPSFIEDMLRWAVQGAVMATSGYWTLRLFGWI